MLRSGSKWVMVQNCRFSTKYFKNLGLKLMMQRKTKKHQYRPLVFEGYMYVKKSISFMRVFQPPSILSPFCHGSTWWPLRSRGSSMVSSLFLGKWNIIPGNFKNSTFFSSYFRWPYWPKLPWSQHKGFFSKPLLDYWFTTLSTKVCMSF